MSGVRGTDLATTYGNSLRGYAKDSITLPNRGGIAVKLAEKYMQNKL
jgi:hypothetical protein